MTDTEALPQPTFLGGAKALTATPVVGEPAREYSEMFVPGEQLANGELRVTVLGSGTPWVTRAQAAPSILVEVGNPELDLFLLDAGSGSMANFSGLGLPVNALNKVFLTHLHADHTPDLITLFGSYRKGGRVGPVEVWGPSGSEPRYGTRHFVEAIREACNWDSESTRGIHADESFRLEVTEFDFSQTQVIFERNGVRITSFPVIHGLDGAVGYRLDYAGRSFVHSGDTRPCKTLVEAADGDLDLLIHECFPPPQVLAQAMGMPVEQASTVINLAHTTPRAAGKVFSLVQPRMAGLWHTMLNPDAIPLTFAELRKVYTGPVVQTQDLTVFNVTEEAVVARQAQVPLQAAAVTGEPTLEPTIGERPSDPDWWAEAAIPIDDVLALD